MKIYESVYFYLSLGVLVVMILAECGVVVDENYSDRDMIVLFLAALTMARVDCILYMVKKLYDKHIGDSK